jgi:hypothetical protein
MHAAIEQDDVAAPFRHKSRVLVENAGHNVSEARPIPWLKDSLAVEPPGPTRRHSS